MQTIDGQAFPDDAEDGMRRMITGPVDLLVADAELICRMHPDIWNLARLLHPEVFAAPRFNALSPTLQFWSMLIGQHEYFDVDDMVRDVVREVIREWIAKGELK